MITDKAYDTLMYALVNAKIYYKITNEEFLWAYKELVRVKWVGDNPNGAFNIDAYGINDR
jgi:hypothetical protein